MPARHGSGPYIPRADGALRTGLENFSSVIAADPGAVGLSPADAAALTALARRYAAAYARATAAGSRSKTTVAAKNAVRREVWETVRPMAMRIKHDARIGKRVKIDLGVKPPHAKGSPIRPPRTPPLLEVVQTRHLVHRLRYGDRDHPGRFAKPPGVTQVRLCVVIAPDTVRTRTAGRQVTHIVTRHTFDIRFGATDEGQVATYFACWATKRGLTSPWSRGVSMRIV